MNPAKSVDIYIKSYPKKVQTTLRKIRKIIRKAAPKAEETISYRIPTFKMNGEVVAHFAAFKDHISLFPPAPRKFRKEVAQYANKVWNLMFPLDKPIPYGLISRIVKFRMKRIKTDK